MTVLERNALLAKEGCNGVAALLDDMREMISKDGYDRTVMRNRIISVHFAIGCPPKYALVIAELALREYERQEADKQGIKAGAI